MTDRPKKQRKLGPQQQRIVAAGRVLVTLREGCLPAYSLDDGTEVADYSVRGLVARGVLKVGDPPLIPGSLPQSYVVEPC